MIKLLTILTVLPAILAGDFNPQTLSSAQQDSILAQNVESGRYRIEYENEERIFRHSRLAEWFIIDTMRHTRQQLGEGLNLGKVRDAQMSPDGRYVAFAKDNNLYLHKLDFRTEIAVTKDDNPDIINGIADWLYEEEFGTTALYAWSPDSKQLAFVRLDETEVPSFSWQNYLETMYPAEESLRYPKAGCNNAKASVCIYDVATKAIRTMQLNNPDDVYLPRLRWNKDELLVLRLNRDQTKMEILSCNPKSTVSQLLYKEESKDFFMDYSLFDEWQWLSDGRFIVLSEKDGWRRAYLYSQQGVQQKALTPDNMDVTALYAVDEKTSTLYYQAAPTPSTRHIYAVNIKKGDIAQLTKEDGTHSAHFFKEDATHTALFSKENGAPIAHSSKGALRFIECFHSFNTPHTYSLYTAKGLKAEKNETILDNTAMNQLWKGYELPEPELLRIPNGNGQELEAMLLQRPVTNDQRPLVVMHYSGPQSQRVLNRWRKKFEYALVEAGYAVLIVDSRGSDCRGRAWRNETYMSLGQKEAQDLIAAANHVGKFPYIDSTRIALLGWSYGGYQTLYTMCQKDHPFKAGIAIAPVTDWRLYDTGYTERFMRRPQVNERGYRNASLLDKAADLTGNILIIHGTADDNVHVQHTMQFIDALVKADKQFEMQLYPDDNHHLRKGKNAKHMHERILLFLQNNL